ncbi:chorismate-binding protein [Variovorax saccharolyticus]|uniref:chorismate-binding protein n=1 Tax=Variovorax saccharolyticus TaxID=3053516 RepID=UPI0025759ADE|nr:chorismate-binding protein [Variovorax sp. J31P216]MDM0030348.1 chorismate-binding protein [Variovorax sp. J31P216]
MDPQAPRLRYAFGAPLEELVANRIEDVRPLLDAVHRRALQGQWCVGFVRYEAAPAFDSALVVHEADGPLAWFGIHAHSLPWPDSDDAEENAAEVTWSDGPERSDFNRALAEIHRAISAGELYQVNYTAALRNRPLAAGDALPEAHGLFAALQRAQPGGYAAFIDTGREQILSVSPELFFDWRDSRLLTRPMKGTAARGFDSVGDAEAAAHLRTSPKERSENVMIVDLLRNDMSRIAEPLSVRVTRLFHTEALSTVWQMTSDIEATTRASISLGDVFAALFPCGSVTGAPKVAAMRMIHRLEAEARGIYCGALGLVQPGGAATFNVPIRTVTLGANGARCGIGSGITGDAVAAGEWAEWRSKRAFLDRAGRPFELLETMALIDGRLRDVEAHLARMSVAARHFRYPWRSEALDQALDALCQSHPSGCWRVRLLCDRRGVAKTQIHPLESSPAQVRLVLSAHPFDAYESEFVRFKTTRRGHYEAFAPPDPSAFDTILWNPRGEITECTRGNVALQLDGRWVTPPLQCGLLAGIGRERLLREGRLTEEIVHRAALSRVTGGAFINSLRGWIDAILEEVPMA